MGLVSFSLLSCTCLLCVSPFCRPRSGWYLIKLSHHRCLQTKERGRGSGEGTEIEEMHTYAHVCARHMMPSQCFQCFRVHIMLLVETINHLATVWNKQNRNFRRRKEHCDAHLSSSCFEKLFPGVQNTYGELKKKDLSLFRIHSCASALLHECVRGSMRWKKYKRWHTHT